MKRIRHKKVFLYFSDVQGSDETDIPFFKKCVQKYYALEPPEDFTDAQKKKYQKPQFEEYLRKKEDPTKFELFEVCHVKVAGTDVINSVIFVTFKQRKFICIALLMMSVPASLTAKKS